MKIIPIYTSEQSLIEQLLAKSPRAQKEFYEQYAPRMLAVCNRYMGDLQCAEDILMEGFIKAFNNIASYGFKGSFEGWLRRIFVNTALDHLRKNKKHFFENSFSAVIGLDKSLAEEEEALETEDFEILPSLELLLKLIAALENPYGLVFNLYVLDGCTHKEIAGILNITEANSKSILHRARKQLQQSLKLVNTISYERVHI